MEPESSELRVLSRWALHRMLTLSRLSWKYGICSSPFSVTWRSDASRCSTIMRSGESDRSLLSRRRLSTLMRGVRPSRVRRGCRMPPAGPGPGCCCPGTTDRTGRGVRGAGGYTMPHGELNLLQKDLPDYHRPQPGTGGERGGTREPRPQSAHPSRARPPHATPQPAPAAARQPNRTDASRARQRTGPTRDPRVFQ